MTWLTVMAYQFHKWPWIWSTCPKHILVLSSYTTYYRVCNYISTTGGTSGAGTVYSSGSHEFNPIFSGVRVTRFVVLYVCFVDRRLSFCTFIFKPLYCLSFCHFLASDYLFGIFKLFLLSRSRINIWNDTGIESIICPVLRVWTENMPI
jgi:hypothetical protein